MVGADVVVGELEVVAKGDEVAVDVVDVGSQALKGPNMARGRG